MGPFCTPISKKTNVIYEDNVHHKTRKSLEKRFEKQFKDEPNLQAIMTDVERLIVSPTVVIETGIWSNTGANDSSRQVRVYVAEVRGTMAHYP